MNWLAECGFGAAIGDIIRLCIGSILLFAGFSKLKKLPDITDLLKALGLKVNRNRVITGLLVFFEISTGVWLLTGIFSNAVLILTTMLFVLLTALLWVLVRKEYEGSCACFGSLDTYGIGPISDCSEPCFTRALTLCIH